jgi:hypothetical protein
MRPTVPFVRPAITPEPPALVTVISRADVIWNQPDRHCFRAPPLHVRPPLNDVADLATERRREWYAF